MLFQNNTVVEDMIIPPPSQTYLRRGYRAIQETQDGTKYLIIIYVKIILLLYFRGRTITTQTAGVEEIKETGLF